MCKCMLVYTCIKFVCSKGEMLLILYCSGKPFVVVEHPAAVPDMDAGGFPMHQLCKL